MNGLLLINLGTPDAPTPGAVRKYLREFLSDPRVLDIHPIARSLLLHLVILPTRPQKSAAAYQKVWNHHPDAPGSPLLAYSVALTRQLQTRLGEHWRVALGMRYGQPSLQQALETLLCRPEQGRIERLVALPLYPQRASSSTGSSIEALTRTLGQRQSPPPLCILGPFFDDAGFLDALAERGRPLLAEKRPDFVLFSYHGLPERHIRKADDEYQAGGPRHCLVRPDCCDQLSAKNADCYRAQCFATTRGLVERLGLTSDQHSTCFQSRLGRTPWIRPFTDEILTHLARTGKRRLVVFCPAFVAECLETLEEIALRADAAFRAAGGESLTLVPAVNASPTWVEALAHLVEEQTQRF
jgi:ferrochelatase